jgi:hypothetical protein|nr:MAG TPA: hypothetical protein [Caudoviricetes sp.]DAP82193.1 MAG TPA: hypothetical protein [Caudoviricetes sp.]
MVDASTIGVIQALYGTGANGGIPTPLVTDKTLALENRAADAKAAGDAIRAVTNTANTLSARANVLSGSVSGASITATDSFAAPFVGLRVCGKSTQDGTPLPTAPVPIVSAGDGGTVVVTVSDGANNSQTLTLQTPNALPGIPVTSGGNYTDENGQQWVCDEVDLARGVRVQRITKIKVTSSLNWQTSGQKVDRYFAWFAGTSATNVLCTHFSTTVGSEAVGGAIANQNNLIGFAYAQKGTSTLDEFKAFLDAKDVYVWTSLATPVETALSAAEIAAYKALTTYAPTTSISVTDGAGAAMKYQRDVNIVIKNLEDAIASMTQN